MKNRIDYRRGDLCLTQQIIRTQLYKLKPQICIYKKNWKIITKINIKKKQYKMIR
jgi:hypothetical protein